MTVLNNETSPQILFVGFAVMQVTWLETALIARGAKIGVIMTEVGVAVAALAGLVLLASVRETPWTGSMRLVYPRLTDIV